MTLCARHVQLEAPSERLLIRKILSREDLVDKGNLRSFTRVLRREQPPAHELDPQRLEVAGTDRVLNAVRLLPLRRRWLSLDDERREVRAFKRQTVRHGDRVNTGQRFDARLQLAQKA